MKLRILNIVLAALAPQAPPAPPPPPSSSLLQVHCPACETEDSIPRDWKRWRCTACGTANVGPAGSVAQHSREWVRAHRARNGLKLVAGTTFARRDGDSLIAQLAARQAAPAPTGGDAA